LNSKDYFLNEIENQAANYFTKHLKFDVVPDYGKAFIKTTEQVLNRKITPTSAKRSNRKRSYGAPIHIGY
jgi:hypothetical protein